MLKIMILKPVMLKLTYAMFLHLSTLLQLVSELFSPCLSPLLLQQQHVQKNEARNYKWEMDIFGK
jgi:hypothetical protein